MIHSRADGVAPAIREELLVGMYEVSDFLERPMQIELMKLFVVAQSLSWLPRSGEVNVAVIAVLGQRMLCGCYRHRANLRVACGSVLYSHAIGIARFLGYLLRFVLLFWASLHHDRHDVVRVPGVSQKGEEDTLMCHYLFFLSQARSPWYYRHVVTM